VNVRSRGGSSGKPDLEVLHPPSKPPLGPLASISPPSPVFPHFLAASSSLGLGGLQEQAGVASRRRGRSRRRRWSRGWPRRWAGDERARGLGLSLDQYSRISCRLDQAGHCVPKLTFSPISSHPSYRAILYPPPPRPVHPSSFLSVPPRPLGRPTLSANPRDLHPPRRVRASRREENFSFRSRESVLCEFSRRHTSAMNLFDGSKR
jgi:hypothetical protein